MFQHTSSVPFPLDPDRGSGSWSGTKLNAPLRFLGAARCASPDPLRPELVDKDDHRRPELPGALALLLSSVINPLPLSSVVSVWGPGSAAALVLQQLGHWAAR